MRGRFTGASARCALRPAEGVEVKGSAVARSPGVDRKGVDAATSDQRVEAIINEAVSGHSGEAFESIADDPHREVAAFLRPGVADVQVAVVLDSQADRLQSRRQRLFEIGRGDAHLSLVGGAAGPRRPDEVSIGSATGFRWRLR